MKTKKQTIKKAVVKMNTATMTNAQKVKFAHDTQTTAQGSPAFQGSPTAQASMTAWQATTTSLDQNQSDINKAEQQLVTLRQQEVQHVFDFEVAATNYGGVVQSIAKGDAAIVSSLGLAVRVPATPTVEIQAPLGLQIKTSKAGVESLVWDKVPGAHLYIMQMSVDPATDATWTTVPGGGRKRKLVGLVHGQKYLLRVKALGAKLEGPWSAVLGITGM